MEKKKKNFDAVEWTRRIRDKNFEELGDLPTKDFLHILAERGEKSELGKKLREKAKSQKNPGHRLS